MLRYRINILSAAISLSLHAVLLLILACFINPSWTVNEQRDELYLVNLATPKIQHAALETVKQQRHSYSKPQLNPVGNLIHTLISKPLVVANASRSRNNKILFSPKIETTLTKPAVYARITAKPLSHTQQQEIALINLNPSTSKLSLSKGPSPALPKKQAKITHSKTPSNELLTYQKTIRSKILASKIYPLIARKKEQAGVVYLNFLVLRDGHLKEVNLINSSKHEVLDQAAIKTVQKASPFLPLPTSLDKDELRLKIAISFVLEILK